MSQDIAEHFRLWLRAGMTGCEFARLLAGKANRVAIELHVDAALPPTDWLNNTFDVHAEADRSVIAVFPRIQDENGLVGFLMALHEDDRWRVCLRRKTTPTGAALVALEWKTKEGVLSETMGLAPFPTMPVPRRAPYVAIATWPGRRANPFRGTPPTPPGVEGKVSFLDAFHELDSEEYGKRWEATSDQVAKLMSIPPDDAKLYRSATFAISQSAAAPLQTL